jgi:hypothetical protein
MRSILLSLASLFTVIAADAQHPPNVSADAMQKLAYLVGEWRGTASVMTGPGGPVEAAQHEVVEWAAGGTVLTIAGRGTVIEGGVERVVHDAFATIWWDAEANGYRMRAHLANGQAVDAEPVVTADTLVWGFRHPQAGQIRYTITRTVEGDWHEIGERSADGKTNWMKVIEMRLTKTAIAP